MDECILGIEIRRPSNFGNEPNITRNVMTLLEPQLTLVFCVLYVSTKIYVPIEELTGHWYLMVMCLENQVIYHLDTYNTVDTNERREDNMKAIVCGALKPFFPNILKL